MIHTTKNAAFSWEISIARDHRVLASPLQSSTFWTGGGVERWNNTTVETCPGTAKTWKNPRLRQDDEAKTIMWPPISCFDQED
jgi:hypothetical protein